MNVWTHGQTNVTDHQLHDQVNYGRSTTDYNTISQKNWNVWIQCIYNIDQTLESEENGMQDHGAFVYIDVWVVLLQFWTGLKYFADSKDGY